MGNPGIEVNVDVNTGKAADKWVCFAVLYGRFVCGILNDFGKEKRKK